MGGKGSGGNRAGAGRKPKNQQLGELSGSRRVRARKRTLTAGNQNTANQNEGNQKASDSAAPQPPEPPPMLDPAMPLPPASITLEELAEWNDLAPRAFAKGTLGRDEVYALRDLCQLRVLKERLLRTVADHGDVVRGANGQLAAHPLLTRITTLSQRIEAGMAKFQLSPMGKAIELPKAPEADPFSEFDEPSDGDAPDASKRTH